MKTVAIVIARMGSTRLPGKVLMPLGGSGRHVLDWVISAAEVALGVDEVWVATTLEQRDRAIAEWCQQSGIPCHRGSEEDVLERFLETAVKADAEIVIRLTGDCPFQDPMVISELVALQRRTDAAFVSNVNPATWPDGLDCEVFTRAALEAAYHEATTPSDRDTVTQYISRNRYRWPSQTLICPIPGLHRERWVLDTENDYRFCQEVVDRLKTECPSYLDILRILDEEPKLRFINQDSQRNERFHAKLADELDTKERSYQTSRTLLARALKVTPYGSGTYSKSHVAYGTDNGPLALSHGSGGWTWDPDGNGYVDLVSGLTAVILGHCDPDVDAAVREQLASGNGFSLATPLEAQLAEELSNIIPCAEMSMFAKNGSDVTAAAVRLARGIWEDRDHFVRHPARILTFEGSYHGWHDWSLCHDPVRSTGTIDCDTVKLPVGTSFEGEIGYDPDQFAAIIVEPDQHKFKDLIDMRMWCDEHKALLIFDECLTGMRYPGGSYQHFANIIPDLACFGKGLANGYSVSALCGSAEYMRRLAPGHGANIFFSGTHFGEAVPLAAALATLAKVQAYDVPKILRDKAENLAEAFLASAQKHGLDGIDTWEAGQLPLYRITWKKGLAPAFRHHMAQAGVLYYGFFGVNFAHTLDDLKRVRLAFDYAFSRIAAGDTNYSVPQTGIMRR